MIMNQFAVLVDEEFNIINEITDNFELNVNVSNMSSYLQDQEELCEVNVFSIILKNNIFIYKY